MSSCMSGLLQRRSAHRVASSAYLCDAVGTGTMARLRRRAFLAADARRRAEGLASASALRSAGRLASAVPTATGSTRKRDFATDRFHRDSAALLVQGGGHAGDKRNARHWLWREVRPRPAAATGAIVTEGHFPEATACARVIEKRLRDQDKSRPGLGSQTLEHGRGFVEPFLSVRPPARGQTLLAEPAVVPTKASHWSKVTCLRHLAEHFPR